jgi:hypothetical protein
MPKGIYLPHQNQTYIYDDSGHLASILGGDQSNNQAALFQGYSSNGLGSGTKGQQAARSQVTKDMVVDMASQLPLVLGPEELLASKGLAIAARGVGSLISGFGVDRLVNPDKSVGSSVADAAINTGVGGVINRLPFHLPNTDAFDEAKGWGIKGIMGGLLNALIKGKPLYEEVPKTTPVIRGVGGKFISNAVDYAKWLSYSKKMNVLKNITNMFGFGANSAIDTANDTDSNTPTP